MTTRDSNVPRRGFGVWFLGKGKEVFLVTRFSGVFIFQPKGTDEK